MNFLLLPVVMTAMDVVFGSFGTGAAQSCIDGIPARRHHHISGVFHRIPVTHTPENGFVGVFFIGRNNHDAKWNGGYKSAHQYGMTKAPSGFNVPDVGHRYFFQFVML